MGWDAWAEIDCDRYYKGLHDRAGLADPRLDAIFSQTHEKALKEAPTVDRLLRVAGLDVSDCAVVLEQAAGIDAYGPKLSADEVRAALKRADWAKVADQGDGGQSLVSTRCFLEACVEAGVGISFSW